jgi:hypothetical protein
MRRPSPSVPNADAAEVFERWCTPSVMNALYRYAVSLGLAPIDAERAGRVEAMELVNMMFEHGLAGDFRCTLGEDATQPQAVRYLKKRLFWMWATLFRREVPTVGDDETLDALPDATPDALERLSGYRMCAGVIAAVARDPEASAYFDKMQDCKPREDIARELGMSIGQANAVRKRIARCAEAYRTTLNDNDEDEPQRSSPRGDHHGQTVEERRGAPPLADRGAGGARRRR